MKIRKKEFQKLKKEELETKYIEIKKELMKENAQVARGTIPKSSGLLKQLKKSIARINTLLHQQDHQQIKNSWTKKSKKGSLKKE